VVRGEPRRANESRRDAGARSAYNGETSGGPKGMSSLDPAVSFLIVVLIGIIAGILAQRIWRTSWISDQIAGRHRGGVHRLPPRDSAESRGERSDRAVHRRRARCRPGVVGMEDYQAVIFFRAFMVTKSGTWARNSERILRRPQRGRHEGWRRDGHRMSICYPRPAAR